MLNLNRQSLGIVGSALILSVGMSGCLHHRTADVVPALRIGTAEEVGPRLTNYSEATVPADGTIVVRSDDFVGSASPPPPKKGKPVARISLADALANATGLKVVDQSQPGETLAAAAERLKDAPVGNLMIICYGFGDAANPNDADFSAGLVDMIQKAHDGGAAVYLIVEPATTLPLSNDVEPFRAAFRAKAAAQGAGLIDPTTFLAQAGLGPSKSAWQSKAAVQLIAGSVAAYIKVAPKAEQ